MAEIFIDKLPRLINVSNLILGHFIEHLGMCINNGVWTYKKTEQTLMQPPLDRVRTELFERISSLRPPIIRYPGGCFSDTYHWKDGIGPRSSRPIRKNKAWGGFKSVFGLIKGFNIGPKEKNHFGTDEFLTLCEKLGAEKYININFGTGTPKEAAEWVEYTNGSLNTKYGKLRAKNGHPEPYNVKFWGIGNEIFGWWEKGHCKTGDIYGKKYLEFAKEMRKIDSNIKLLGVGWKSDWNRSFLRVAKGYVDYLTLHLYLPTINIISYLLGWRALPKNENVYYSMLNSPYLAEELILKTRQDIISTLGKNGLEQVKIAFDEWNIWYRWRQVYRADTPHYNLRDGLWTACMINTFIKQAETIGMANFAQMVNVLGMILTYDDKIIVNPNYLVFKMYSDVWLKDSSLLSVSVKCKNIISEQFANIPPIMKPVLDVAAMISRDKSKLTLFCVNKHLNENIDTCIKFSDSLNFTPENVIGYILTHDTPFAINSRENPNTIKVQKLNFVCNNDLFKYKFPAHSVVVFQFLGK